MLRAHLLLVEQVGLERRPRGLLAVLTVTKHCGDGVAKQCVAYGIAEARAT
jgi:hypothetical protein